MKDREKEFRERVKCGIAYCEDTPNKQIEEMAKDCYYVAHLLRFNDPYMLSLKGWSKLTKEMIKLGWIKPTEDSVVISREEWRKYIDNENESYYRGQHETEVYYENIKIPQERKKAAREFYDKFNKNICYFELKNKSTEYKEGYIQAVADICGKLDKTAIELGVDLREYYGKL